VLSAVTENDRTAIAGFIFQDGEIIDVLLGEDGLPIINEED